MEERTVLLLLQIDEVVVSACFVKGMLWNF
jgi:hypothetical protein